MYTQKYSRAKDICTKLIPNLTKRGGSGLDLNGEDVEGSIGLWMLTE